MRDAARMVGVVKNKANYETVAIALRHLSARTIFHRTLLHFNDPEKEDQQVETSLSALKRSEKNCTTDGGLNGNWLHNNLPFSHSAKKPELKTAIQVQKELLLLLMS